MAIEQSILKSTKKILGLDAEYDAFDLDVITHINTAFFTLNQLGIGPAGGFAIEDDSETWEDYIDPNVGLSARHALKSYIYFSVRLAFDPPGTPHHIKATEDQKAELTHRLLMERELKTWSDPQSSSLSLP